MNERSVIDKILVTQSSSASMTMSISQKASFSTLDYVLFSLSLALSLSIALYYGCKNVTTNQVLFADKQLGVLPVAMSLVATVMSAISLLGFPAEIYQNGTMFCYLGLTYFLVFPVATYVFLPLLYKLQLPSVYKYLELRFNSSVKQLASAIFCMQIITYLAVGLYAPALALKSVTNISMLVTILATGLVCVLYTSIGGAKTVVWTNVLQFFLIVFGLLAVAIIGVNEVGGFSNMINLANKGGRINFYDFSPDPRVRHSFWSLMIGGSFTFLTLYTSNQMTVQRYVSMKSLRDAQISLLLNIPLNLIVISLFTLMGLIIYASFYGCDPKTAGVKKADAILPYFVLNNLSKLSGIPGLFVSAIYGAGLSTVSAGLSSLSAVILEDFLKPYYLNIYKTPISDHQGAICAKIIVLLMGTGIICLAYLFSVIETTLLQIALSIFGILGGPILGAFCLGMFFKRPNAKGAFVGLLAGVATTLWIGLGAIFYGPKPSHLPVSIDNCSLNDGANFSTVLFSTEPLLNFTSLHDVSIPPKSDPISFSQIYHLSYQYYSFLGVLVVLIVGHVVSFLTRCCFGEEVEENDDPNLHIDLFSLFTKSNSGNYNLEIGETYKISTIDHTASNVKSITEKSF